MQDYVHSGYYNIYRPPYSLTNNTHRSTIYCVSDRFNATLILVPLVPSFYRDVIEIVKNHPARYIYLIAPDVSIAFVSDYYLAWNDITKVFKRSCKIFSKYMIENFTRMDFKSAIIRNEMDNISIDIPRSDTDIGTMDVTLTKAYVSSASPFSCDVILKDTYKSRLFVGEMNDHKAQFLNSNRELYDEIHMPYMTGNYAGMTYNALLKKYPALVSRVYANQFASAEEYSFAKANGVKIGGEFKQ